MTRKAVVTKDGRYGFGILEGNSINGYSFIKKTYFWETSLQKEVKYCFDIQQVLNKDLLIVTCVNKEDKIQVFSLKINTRNSQLFRLNSEVILEKAESPDNLIIKIQRIFNDYTDNKAS